MPLDRAQGPNLPVALQGLWRHGARQVSDLPKESTFWRSMT